MILSNSLVKKNHFKIFEIIDNEHILYENFCNKIK